MTINEALKRAYVARWNEGRAAAANDDHKHEVAADLGDQVDVLATQADLLAELGRCAVLLEGLAERLYAHNRALSQRVAEAAHSARAAIVKARSAK